MKLPSSVVKLLENKYVLYFVLFLAVTNILGYMMMGNIKSVIFFILVAYLISNFSKNMIIILAIPLILTSVLMIGQRVKEGLENPKDEKEKLKKTEKVITSPDADETVGDETVGDEKVDEDPVDDPVGDDTKKSGMTTMYKKNNRIDYAATVEDAYDDLNKILGGDGIKRLTDDTQKLMGHQMQLADAMKSMSPLLEQAKSLLKGFDLKNLDGLASLATTFKGGKV